MNKHYDKEINLGLNAKHKQACVNLFIGASTGAEFDWIVENTDLFLQESIAIYNKIISAIAEQENTVLYFVTHESKKFTFTAVERHLGIWHHFKKEVFSISQKTSM